jgi:hypothetical protein
MEGAVKGVLSGLRNDDTVRVIAENIVAARGSADAAARDLEALSFVTAAVRSQSFKYNVIESDIKINVSRTIPIGRHLCTTEGKYDDDDMVSIDLFYCTIRLRIVRNHHHTSLEFVSTDFRNVAVLNMRVIPTAAPPADILQAVRETVWAAAKEPA